MDVLGAEVGGGVIAGQEIIIGIAVRQAGGGDGIARGRQVFGVEIGAKPGIGRHHPLGNNLLGLFAQFRLALRRDAVGKLFERRIERAVFRVIDHLRVDLVRYPLHDGLRRRASGLDAFAHQHDVLVDQRRQFIETRQPVDVRLLGPEIEQLGDAVGGLYAALMGHRHQVFAVTLALDVALELPFEGVVIELVGRRQRGAVDGLQFRQRGFVGGLARTDGGQAHIGPAVVVAGIAVIAGVLGIVAQAALPFLFEQLVQRRVFLLRAGRHADQQQGKHQGD